MSITLALRSTSLDLFRAGSRKTHAQISTFLTGALVAGAGTGIFGDSKIDMRNTGSGAKSLAYPGMENIPLGTAMSFLFRIIPDWTGNPATTQDLFQWASGTGVYAGVWACFLKTDGQMHLLAGNNSATADICNAASVGAGLTFVSGQPCDIWITWDGTVGAGKIKVWQAQNGNVPTEVASFTANTAAAARKLAFAGGIAMAYSTLSGGAGGTYYLNEAVFFDTNEDPASYGARTDFIATTAYEGGNYTSLAASHVRSGTVYGPGPGSLTGTAAIPTAAQVLSGVAVDAGTGTVVQASVGDVRDGVTFGPSSGLTGTAAIPTAAQVLDGVAVDNTVGTVVLPAVTDVLKDVAFGAGSADIGTLVLNQFTQASLIGRAPPSAAATVLVLSQGDSALLNFTALDGPTAALFDLTGASFETRIKGTSGDVVLANSAHTANPDQVTHKGKFTLAITAAEALLLKIDDGKEIVTKVTQGSTVIHFHGTAILNVIDDVPVA